MSLAKALDADQRADALQHLAAGQLDVLVVGGGIVGVGAALDAVTRGLKVGLVEQRDLASGTSSRSSKLVHGGLRYLEMFDFALVKEALEERGLLYTRLAPHLVRPVPFLYPLEHAWERPYVGAGVALYDGMAMTGKYDMGVPKHKHVFRKQLARMAPDIRTEGLHGAIRYYDCQVDDARLVMTIARTAANNGAHVATRTKVTGFLREGDSVVGVSARDLEGQRDLEIRAKVVINAAGVWTDEVQDLIGGQAQLDVDASKGIHIVVPKDRIRSECGFITKTEKSVLFVIPWDQFWIIGTTDTAWDYDLAHPAASKTDIDYLLGHVNRLLKDPLDHRDVIGVWAGLRPLLKPMRKEGEMGETTKLSREHTVANPVPGLVLVAGGKLTTYRVMARDAVDHAIRDFEATPASITDRVPLMGAWGFEARTNQRVALSRSSGLDIGLVDHLLGRYGGLVDEVLAMIDARPDLGEPLEGAEHYLRAEVLYAVTHEGARHLDDVLARRTRVSIETFDRGITAARPAAELMAGALGWSEAQLEDEVDHYLRRVEAERQSQLMPTDQEADEARVKAPDIV
ncbi:glycerol-3-phosphate dehydrogenase/oxidase [Nocardioides oleivorans]|uniref:Glycerol-3-phosphate dehydrogenase n=1 Tax=Nocardioides oleivorans TaxID=273676 RepID=A0A4Q2RVY8_9ACTN|nr:glycerol-3-phosphate dehydrogenase/oxidase [Nocardioides oleivorans]RYB93257.1 glycerol-3-phosphate dehydrogenase/oxidase [Nocardioides oleivorans]